MAYYTAEKDVYVLNTDESIQPVKIYTANTTALNNIEAAEKAQKVVRNGQLFIEKNGVLYNAQGAVVK